MNKTILIRGGLLTKNNIVHIDEVVYNIRKWFDGEVVVSTWSGQEHLLPSNLLIDKVVYTDDPGPGPVGNLKRQVLSMMEGLKHCSGEMVLSIRPDILLTKDIFAEYYEIPYKNEISKIFKNRILTCSHMSIDKDNFYDAPEHARYFRISDWLHLGHKEDLVKMCDILEIFDGLEQDKIVNNGWYQYKNCECCEQFWGLCLIKKYFQDFNLCDIESIKEIHYNYICNNFIIKNTMSDLGALNITWDFQPEDTHFYITKEKYEKYYDNQ